MRSPRNQITLEVRETSWPLPWPWAGMEAGKERGRKGEGAQAGRGCAGRVLHPSSAGDGAVTAAEILVILWERMGQSRRKKREQDDPPHLHKKLLFYRRFY